MAAEQFDYGHERQRPDRFVGRAALLARLDQLLVDGDADRWVVVTGGAGTGKTALLAAWLARREAAGAVVPHHFIRRGEYEHDDPARLVGSLVAQIDGRVVLLGEPEAHTRIHPAARLAAVLARAAAEKPASPAGWLAALRARVSGRQARRGRRLVVVLDGLDEYDPPAGATGDPLAAFLPPVLPGGVSVLCTSRPGHPSLASLVGREGEVVQIDLDDPACAADHEATVRALWKQAARGLGVDARLVDDAVACARGNALHAVALQAQLRAAPADQRRAEDLPRGLDALLASAWQRASADAGTAAGLGILCAAREPLTLDHIADAASGVGEICDALGPDASALVVETARPDGAAEHRIRHAAIRAYLAGAIGEAGLRAYHGALAQRLARWPAAGDAAARRYALRHALHHRAEAGDWAGTWRVAADTGFLEARCRELGVHETCAEVAQAAERCRAGGDAAVGRRLGALAGALVREAAWLGAEPEATAAVIWNRLRRAGWSAEDLDAQLGIPAGAASFLRVRSVATRDSPALVRELAGHAGHVHACAIAADGRRAVSVSDDRTLRVWDLETGRALAILKGHVRDVRGCAVTADGRRAVTASDDATLKVWDLDRRRAIATLVGHDREVNACAVTADGGRVISASSDGTLRVWELATGRALATLEGHTDWVTGCVVTADGGRVISASADQTLRVWELATGRALAVLEGHTDRINACAVTPDGRHVVAALWDGTLEVRELASGQVRARLEGHASGVTACAVTADGERVVSASKDGTLRVWELATGRALAVLEGHAAGVNACVVTADGRRVISASDDRTLRLWDLHGELAAMSAGGHARGHARAVVGCAVMPDGRAVSASSDGTLKLWDRETGRVRATLDGPRGGVNACTVTPDGRRAIAASNDGALQVWDLETGRAVATLKGHAERVLACAVTADGRRAVSGSEDKRLKVWDLERGRAIASLKGHAGSVTACAVTPDGRRVVSGSRDWTLKVWDLETGAARATLKGHSGLVNACAVTPDGRRVVSASWDRTLAVWDLETGRALATLKGHTGSVNACAVTPDGRHAISVSDDRTLRLWDLATHACVHTHRGDAAFAVVVAAAGEIVAGDTAGGVWFLDWPPPDRGAVRRAGRSLAV